MSDLKALFDQVDAFKLAPIDSWHPEKTVKIDIRITCDGNWFYQGSKIDRHRIVKLFSTVLRLEDDHYYLVTPPLKYQIQVDEVPFAAVEINQQSNAGVQQLFFRTNMDEIILADQIHPITVVTDELNGWPSPYILVRDNLRAKITRSVYYELVEILQPGPDSGDPSNEVGVFSAGVFFPFGTV